jgi:hypothetical protein
MNHGPTTKISIDRSVIGLLNIGIGQMRDVKRISIHVNALNSAGHSEAGASSQTANGGP